MLPLVSTAHLAYLLSAVLAFTIYTQSALHACPACYVKVVSKYLIGFYFYVFLVSFSNIRLILSNRTYSVRIIASQKLVILSIMLCQDQANTKQMQAVRIKSSGFKSQLHYQLSQALVAFYIAVIYTCVLCTYVDEQSHM